MENLSIIAITSGIISLLSLVVLHIVSPQYQASWRMVSEYAYGRHKWLITLFFVLWGLSTILTSILLWNIVTSNWALFGVLLVFVSGIGAIMGGLFDVKHKLHGQFRISSLPVTNLVIA